MIQWWIGGKIGRQRSTDAAANQSHRDISVIGRC